MRGSRAWIVLLVCAIAGGCAAPLVTEPARSATEQLMLSTAADLAVEKMDLAALAGRRVYVDSASFEGVDKAYAIASIASRINQAGGLLVTDVKEADVVAAIRAGALSIDRSSFLLGIPSLSVPSPFGASLQLPELAFLKRVKLAGISKFALNAFERASGKHLLAAGPVSGRSYYNLWTILGLTFHFSNVPEKTPARRWWSFGT